jgi:ribosomal protein L30E
MADAEGQARLSLNVPTALKEDIEKRAREAGMSITEYFKRQVRIGTTIEDAQESGVKIYFESPGEKMHEVLFL